ncbi:DISARM system helicase DrmA [Bradyrhizobium sp. SZCCHNR3015]|uniref:DISARM system helicase DrmA n=1 Tax=Bradyrhizobium sp. SZCCHNR3015 TaxID=3057395 RepID=UPI0029162C16|nr:DISARM system helicase DrmA [Bradyrhizobium sp. SZCCHNR3015]
MTDTTTAPGTANAWTARESVAAGSRSLIEKYGVTFAAPRASLADVNKDDWFVLIDDKGQITRVGRVLRVRSELDRTIVYFDRMVFVRSGFAGSAGLTPPKAALPIRTPWKDFTGAMTEAFGTAPDDVPPIEDAAYIREVLQLAVIDDLLGPAGGPNERILDMGVRDRYLVGKLAPREEERGGIEGLTGPVAAEDEEEPDDLETDRRRHDPGGEFESASGRIDPEADAADEIEAASNQSLVPSSFGFTFCIDGQVDKIEVEARWGRYVRVYEHEHRKKVNRKLKDAEGRVTGTEQAEVPLKVWERVPCGGVKTIDIREGAIAHRPADDRHEEVRLQGTIRKKSTAGHRLITLFLVNAQEEPEENKDSAWVFQPEIIVRAAGGSGEAIFLRRASFEIDNDDAERESLEMIYRRQIEFAVGHGVAVHATTAPDDPEHAVEIRTTVLPTYEVPVTETPGLRAEDRSAMKHMVEFGHLDMEELAKLTRTDLVGVFENLAKDYRTWIDEQKARIGHEVTGFDGAANAALQHGDEIEARLREGIAVLADTHNDKALDAFRFMNRAMAKQRVRGIYALSRRRGENKPLSDFELRKNRSWRPFQLAFILLALPALTDPLHKDRTVPVDSYADLLWFPTGGGKTEAYLGVAAYAMAIRRLQTGLGGLDGSRGLTVIMRYTLRLLTLQQFQRASTLICAMELLRQEALAQGDPKWGETPFTIGLWVGNKVTPGTTADSHKAIQDIRNPDTYDAGRTSPAQLTSCPWCGSEVSARRDVEVNPSAGRTTLYCSDSVGGCEFSKGKSSGRPHPGIPVSVVDEEIYHRPPSMMIATVDKFAMMAWRGETRTLFGRATTECPRHGLLWPDADCTGAHNARGALPRTAVKTISPIRPPDLIIQDEFHLISGPLGTMVGLYETAIDELCSWSLDGKTVRPKIVASTATVRKATEQVNNVFMRRVAVFPPHGLDVADNFFSLQRPIEQLPGRRYIGVCSPGSSRPAMLIRVYVAFLTASQALFDRFGQAADPYMTTVGYFNSLRELGGMKRLCEDDVQTRSYRVEMSEVNRPGLAQRSVSNVRELTSRVSSRDIPKYLDQLEVKFNATYDPAEGAFVTRWADGEARAIDVVLATNMLSVGVDVNRLGLMVVNGQPKGTAEYIQATSRVGRSSPGIVCTVLTWARPRDLSHYETFEQYHATFYKHVEAQSVTPFSPRAMDRGLTGTLLSVIRLGNATFNPNPGAGALDKPDKAEAAEARDLVVARAWTVSHEDTSRILATNELKSRLDAWAAEANVPGRTLAYEKKGPARATTVALLKRPGAQPWDDFTVPMSMREVEPGVRLVMNTARFTGGDPPWTPRPPATDAGDDA